MYIRLNAILQKVQCIKIKFYLTAVLVTTALSCIQEQVQLSRCTSGNTYFPVILVCLSYTNVFMVVYVL